MGRWLYEDDRIKIKANVPGEHDVFVGNMHCYLSRGILKQLAMRDQERLREDLNHINESILWGLKKEGVSLDYFGWALSKARINELEQEVNYFVGKYIDIQP